MLEGPRRAAAERSALSVRERSRSGGTRLRELAQRGRRHHGKRRRLTGPELERDRRLLEQQPETTERRAARVAHGALERGHARPVEEVDPDDPGRQRRQRQLLAMDAQVETTSRRMPLADLYTKATAERRSTLALEPGEFLTAVEVPRAPDASAYVIAGERAAWSFALVGVAAASFGDEVRMAAIGVANLPRQIDPDDPAAGLPGLDMTRWKRRLLETLAADAHAALGR